MAVAGGDQAFGVAQGVGAALALAAGLGIDQDQVRARGAALIVVHSRGDTQAAALADVSLPVPATAELLSPLVTVLPLQLLSYRAALVMGRDIDRPRNLAKSVTVE